MSRPRARPKRPAAPLALALTVMAACCAVWAPAASAGTYDVHVCEVPSSALPELTFINDRSSGITTGCVNGSNGAPTGIMDQHARVGSVVGSRAWEAIAPADTTIKSVTANRGFDGEWEDDPGTLQWTLTKADGTLLDSLTSGGTGNPPTIPPAKVVTWAVGSSSVTSTLGCLLTPPSPCGNGGNPGAGIAFGDLVVTLEDLDQPAFPTLGGSLTPTGSVHGSQTLTYGTSDQGGGVAEVDLLIDGKVADSDRPQNGGKCVVPYKNLVPCPLTLSGTFTIDTTELGEGRHSVAVVATDAGGLGSVPAGFTIDVHNSPVSTAPPALSGSAAVGGQLTSTTGTWDGDPNAFNFTWLRCPATVTTAAGAASCTPILGALDAHFYSATSADAGQRIMVKVVAQNTLAPKAGPTAAFSAPSAVVSSQPVGGPPGGPPPGSDRTPPALSAVSLSHARFRAAKAKRTASLLRLTSSEAGKLTVLIERALPGKQVKRGAKLVCTAVRKPVKRARCTLYKRATTITRTIADGHASIALNGRIGTRKLAPGAYRITLVARDAAGNVSHAKRLTFTLLAG